MTENPCVAGSIPALPNPAEISTKPNKIKGLTRIPRPNTRRTSAPARADISPDWDAIHCGNACGLPDALKWLERNVHEFGKDDLAYVYFLFRGEELTYIGQTQFLRRRINAHRTTEKRIFDRAFYVVLPVALATDIENYYIAKMNPTENMRAGGSRGRQRIVGEPADGTVNSRRSRAMFGD